MAAHPWIAEPTAAELGKDMPELPVSTSPAREPGPAAAELAVDNSADHQANTAWDQPTQARQERAADFVPHGDDFESMLKAGGRWWAGQSTSKNFENIVGQAKAGNPGAFCNEYKLNKISFRYVFPLWGEYSWHFGVPVVLSSAALLRYLASAWKRVFFRSRRNRLQARLWMGRFAVGRVPSPRCPHPGQSSLTWGFRGN